MKILCETREQFERLDKILNRLFENPSKIAGTAEADFAADFIDIEDSGDMSVYLKNEEVKRVICKNNVFSITLSDCILRLKSKSDTCEYEVLIS